MNEILTKHTPALIPKIQIARAIPLGMSLTWPGPIGNRIVPFSDQLCYCGGLGNFGTGETPLAITTADLLWVVTKVFNPIAPTRMPKARTTAPSLRDMEVPPRAGIRTETLYP